MFIKETLKLRAGNSILLEDTELIINNAIYGLVGINGSGKTTLLNYIQNKYNSVYIKQILNNSNESIENIVISVNTKLIDLMTKVKEAYESGYDNKISDAEKSLSDEYDIDKEKAVIRRLLKGLGFNDFQISINSLSGGQQMKINLAGALYMMSEHKCNKRNRVYNGY